MELDVMNITIDKFLDLAKEATRAEMFRNGVKNRLPYVHILCLVDGNADDLSVGEDLFWHDAKTDPPKTPGTYFGKKIGSNHIWSCDYRNGVWTIVYSGDPPQTIEIAQWAKR